MELNRIFIVGAEGEAEEVDLIGRYQECFDAVMAAFVRGIVEGTPFETDRLDNLETLRLMESVYRAAGVEVDAMNRQADSLTPEVDPGRIARLFDIRGLRVFLPGGYGAHRRGHRACHVAHGASVAIAGPNLGKAAEAARQDMRCAAASRNGIALDTRDVEVPAPIDRGRRCAGDGRHRRAGQLRRHPARAADAWRSPKRHSTRSTEPT